MKFYFYSCLTLILLLASCTYSSQNTQITTFQQFYIQLQQNNPTLVHKIYLVIKQHQRKQQAYKKLVAFLRKSAAAKKILQKYAQVIEATYEEKLVYGHSTACDPDTYTLKVYSQYDDIVYNLIDQDVEGTLISNEYFNYNTTKTPINVIVSEDNQRWVNVLDPDNKAVFNYFIEKSSDDDTINFFCRNLCYLHDPVIQKWILPIIPTLPEHLLERLMQSINDNTLCSLLSSSIGTALIKKAPVLKRCSTILFFFLLAKVPDSICYQIALAHIDNKWILISIIQNKHSLLSYTDILDTVLQEPCDNDLIRLFIDYATAQTFAQVVFERPYLWDNELIKTRIFELDDSATRSVKSISPHSGKPQYYDTLAWLANYVRLDSEPTSAAAKKFLRERALNLSDVTKYFRSKEQWTVQSQINNLFHVLDKRKYPGTALRFNMPSSTRSCVVDLNESTHNTLATICHLATDLNRRDERVEASKLLKTFTFLKGTALESMTITFDSLKWYPICLVAGNVTTGLVNPDTAATLGLCLIIYNIYCTADHFKTHFCSMLQAIRNNNYEAAGRYAAHIGIDLVTFKYVYNALKGLKDKFILGMPNISVCQAVEQQIKKTKKPKLSLHDINSQINALPDIVNKKEFAEAFERFSKLPGILSQGCPFSKVLKADNDPGNIKGAWYEIKKALELLKKGEIIESLGIKYTHAVRGEAEFDIQTPRKLIECKNRRWIEYENIKDLPEAIRRNVTKLCSSIKRHKLIAQEVAGKEYELHSYTPIPEAWKKWLTQNEIKYFEDLR